VRRRPDGGKGHLIEAGSLRGGGGRGRNVWIPRWFQVAGRQAGGRGGFAGAERPPVPGGVPQLPRPAIIRLSGATISVNVPDPELGGRQGRLVLKVSLARARHNSVEQQRQRPGWRAVSRNIVAHPADPGGPKAYSVIRCPLIPRAISITGRGAARFSSRVGSNL